MIILLASLLEYQTKPNPFDQVFVLNAQTPEATLTMIDTKQEKKSH